MYLYCDATILAIGIDDEKLEVIRELPVKVTAHRFGHEATGSFRSEKVDTVVSRWDLADMPNGKMLKGIRGIRPGLPLITIVEAGDTEQEKAARCLGVTAVCTADDPDEYLKEIIVNVLGIKQADESTVNAVNNLKSNRNVFV
jgi:DNA-binding NarL/FixJ family response regulator